MVIKSKLILFCTAVLFSSNLFCMICDTQWFPWYPRPFTRTKEKPSRFYMDVFFITSDTVYDNRENEKKIPELYGEYDQDKLGRALSLVGKNNPLPDEFRGNKILWDIDGKIQGQGITFEYEQKLFNPISVGFSWFLMHLHSRHDFSLKTGEVGFLIKDDGDLREIEEARRLMHKELGLCEAQLSVTGMSDFDCYLRIGKIWDYEYKCRSIDAGISFGLMVPSGRDRETTNATSFPLGGNGNWGAFVRGDAEFELKEDMKFGLNIRASKRFKKTIDMRIPVLEEHPLYGALVAPVSVDPGFNIVFSPYFAMENLRSGLGARLGFNFVNHLEDSFFDLRSSKEREKIPSKLDKYRKLSSWGADYASLNIFYDFGKMEVESSYKPVVTLSWDVPFLIFFASNVCKTHRVTLGLEVKF